MWLFQFLFQGMSISDPIYTTFLVGEGRGVGCWDGSSRVASLQHIGLDTHCLRKKLAELERLSKAF